MGDVGFFVAFIGRNKTYKNKILAFESYIFKRYTVRAHGASPNKYKSKSFEIYFAISPDMIKIK